MATQSYTQIFDRTVEELEHRLGPSPATERSQTDAYLAGLEENEVLAKSSEHRLMLAALVDGLKLLYAIHDKDFAENKLRFRMEVLCAIDWLLSSDRSNLFAFISIMDVLGMDADYVRQGVLRSLRVTQDELLEFARREALVIQSQMPPGFKLDADD